MITRKHYELFFTNLSQHAFTACDVVELYLHRGAFEPTLSDEDIEQDLDRWCSHLAWGRECWQVISQWTWNLRLELGHQLKPQPLRTTAFAPAIPEHREQGAEPASTSAPVAGYSPPTTATSWKTGRLTGPDFLLQPDGTLQCPAGRTLVTHERRREGDGRLRVVYAASICSCRPCPLREQCQWQGSLTKKPRQVSVLLHPRIVGGNRSSGKIGVEERIGVRVSNSFVPNASRFRCSLEVAQLLPPSPSLLHHFPVLSEPMHVSRGHSVWLAMLEHRLRLPFLSCSLVCRSHLPCLLVCKHSWRREPY